MQAAVLRAMRATTFAVVCTAPSAGPHPAAGGAAPSPPVRSGALAGTALGAFAPTARRRGFAMLLAAGFLTRYGLHHVFTLGSAGPAAPHDGPPPALRMITVHAPRPWPRRAAVRGEDAPALILHLPLRCSHCDGRSPPSQCPVRCARSYPGRCRRGRVGCRFPPCPAGACPCLPFPLFPPLSADGPPRRPLGVVRRAVPCPSTGTGARRRSPTAGRSTARRPRPSPRASRCTRDAGSARPT